MNRTITSARRRRAGSAAELRLGQIGRRLSQNLVGAAQLSVLSLNFFDARTFISGRASAATLIAFGSSDPSAERLRCTADLL